MSEFLLEWFTAYGLPLFFAVLVISSAGVPFPITLLLIVAGSFVEQGDMQLWQVVSIGIAGAVLGDQIGYFLGRFGGRALVERITNRFGGEEKVKKAENFTNRWGGMGIFFSRWLVTPLGPWLNLTSGTAKFSWAKFAFWGVLGETIWVLIYVFLGKIFSDRVQEVSELMGNISWGIVGLVATVFLGWKLIESFRKASEKAV